MQNIIIREATPDDMTTVHALIVELAVYEKEPDAVENTAADLVMHGFGNEKIFDCIVAEHEDEIVGFALYYTSYSTWKGPSLYLEDFYVQEQHRGNGWGKALFNEVVKEAQKREVRRMEWQVLEWNKPAIEFYEKYGATMDPEWLNGRLFEDDLKRLKL